MPVPLQSIADVAEVTHYRGSAAEGGPDLLIEVAHGATTEAHFDTLRAALHGDYPADLRDFFFVNTDVGAPELAIALAEFVVEADPNRSATVVRCQLPRTFVDCNRVIDGDARGRSSKAAEVTPGLHAWVTDARDRQLLLSRYAAYRALVESAAAQVCGGGGLMLFAHSYAPRSIDVPVDERIVERLRREYEPERLQHWPLRAEIDLITEDPEGRPLAAPQLAELVEVACRRHGLQCERNSAYALHPVTLAHGVAQRFPQSTLCFEVRRDLLVAEFTPFAAMTVDAEKVTRVAAALAAGVTAALG